MRKALTLLLGVVVLLAGCTAEKRDSVDRGASGTIATLAASSDQPGWSQLPEAPLSGRTGASVATVGDRLFVFGGSSLLCPPGADCALPPDPPFTDGAILDLATGSWTPMADLPSSLILTATVVVGDDIYGLGRCGGPQDCPGATRFLRYNTTEDTWQELPLLAAAGSFRLVALGEDVVAYATTDELGPVADQLYDVAAGAWHPLPDDPLPPVYDRFAVAFDGQLLLFGSPLGGGSTKVVAALDPTAQSWESLRESGTQGFQAWRIGSEIVLNPHFGLSAEGGVYDPVEKQWSNLPEGPAAETWNGDMAGVVGSDEATFEYAYGWVLDSTTDTWIEIPPRPGSTTTSDSTIAAVGTSLVVFGGQRWTGSNGELLNEIWRWNP
jgi:hypothetical protein